MRADAPIFGFNSAREGIVREVVGRISSSTPDALLTLNDAAYHEIKRLEASKGKKARAELAEWQKLARTVGRMSDAERRGRLRELAEHYGWDVAGNFDGRVYDLSTRLLPPLVTALLAPRKLLSLARHPRKLVSLEALGDKVLVEGPLEQLREMVKTGTAVYVPTHQSNMDSIVFGYALERAGLPPATYGAGKNLFTNPVLSFFMHNLGAYRVDRRLRHSLYKEVLKTYSTVLLERGYHSLFFPGGTRARSGGVERRLKLGLVGTAFEAYARTVAAGRERRIFFVPATINYLITLEAETLIADYLSEAGKGRFIIEDDESSRLGRVAAFSRKLLDMNGAVEIRFGAPIDPFGNRVDEQCRSFDRRGREIDPATYVEDGEGKVVLDGVRDTQYTRDLGEAICQSYLSNTVAMSTHVVAAACFARLRQATPGGDLFSVLRQRDTVVVPRDELARDVSRLKEQVLDMEKRGEIVAGDWLRHASGGDVVERAVRAFAGTHSTPVLVQRRGGICISDPNLLFYYQNRLAAHGLAWDTLAPPGAPVELSRLAGTHGGAQEPPHATPTREVRGERRSETAAAPRVGVVGGGPWGVALALAATRTGADVTLYTRRDHPEGDKGVRITTDLAEVAKQRLLVVAVPSSVAREVLRALGDHLDGTHLVVHGVRGLSGESLETVSDLMREETPARRLGALGGPVQANELTEGRPSAMVCGSRFPEVTAAVIAAFQSHWLRVYKTPDLRGLEWASALVGCLSIGVGFASQAGAGPGLLAALISRGVDEAARITAAAGADERTMLGLGGYGDLLASIALEDRPEVVVGKALARGLSLEQAQSEARLRVEAIQLIPRIAEFAKARKVHVPTIDALQRVLAGRPAADVLGRLFAAEK